MEVDDDEIGWDLFSIPDAPEAREPHGASEPAAGLNDDSNSEGEGWGSVAKSSIAASDCADDAAASIAPSSIRPSSTTTSGKKRGRPFGIRGGHAFRAQLRESLEKERQENKARPLSRAEILEKARGAKKDKEKTKREREELASASQQRSPEVMHDPYPAVGTEVEHWVCAFSSQALRDGGVMDKFASIAKLRASAANGCPKQFVEALLDGAPDELVARPEDQQQVGPNVDQNWVDLISHIFKPYRAHCSFNRDAQVFSVSDQTMHRTVTRSASALRISASKLWGNFLAHLQSMLRDFDGRLFVVSLRFDETPCKIKVDDEDSYKLPQGPDAPGKSTQAAQQLAKVLQTEVAIAALLRSKQAGGNGSKKHILVSGYVPVPLQVLDRQTAQNMTCALRDSISLPGLLDTASNFDHQTFLYCADEFSANGLCEWALQAETGFMQLSTLCDIHKGSTCQGKVFDLSGPGISAVVNFALLSQHAGSVGKLQAALAEAISHRFELRLGSPQLSFDAVAHRTAVFDLFLQTPDLFTEETADVVSTKSRLRTKQRQQRRIMLEHFFNGDIRDPNKVVHWAPAGVYADKEAALATFLKHVIPCLIPSACPLFPRNRWFGADLTLDYVGLLCSVNNLFCPLAARWCGKPADENLATPDNMDPLEDEGWDFMDDVGDQVSGAAAGEQVAIAEQVRAEEEERQPQGDQNDPAFQGASGPGPEEEAAESTGFDWAAYHQRLRTSVCDWLRLSQEQSGPSPQCQLSLMRQYMAPVLKLMTFLLHVSSKRFTRDQLEKEASGLQREYRICKAFKGAEVSQLLQQVLRLMDSPPVGLLECDWRKDVSVLCFTMLSRLGCSVHQLFVWRCKRYPYRLCLGLGFSFCDGRNQESLIVIC